MKESGNLNIVESVSFFHIFNTCHDAVMPKSAIFVDISYPFCRIVIIEQQYHE